MTPRLPQWLPALLLVVMLTGCAETSYYLQSINGQLEVLDRRQQIADLLADPATDAVLRERLALVLEIREFASRTLALPDNGSYRSYADLQRPYVVWNVFAAPELSNTPMEWCYPIVGCAVYRGYFHEDAARRFAATLSGTGLDVYVAGIPAYSTLGWFDDPVLNTVLQWPDDRLAGLIFHELAHQRVYVKGDSMFNESFATLVEIAGVEQWLRAAGNTADLQDFRARKQREEQFAQLITGTRERLSVAYAEPLSDAEKRQNKAAILASLRDEYASLRQQWDGFPGYDRWFAVDLNNAKLASVSTYRGLLPVFREILAGTDGDFTAFYAQVDALARLPDDQRRARLAALEGG